MGGRGRKRSREDDPLEGSSCSEGEAPRFAPKRARTGEEDGFFSKVVKKCFNWIMDRFGSNRQRGPNATENMTEDDVGPIDMSASKTEVEEEDGANDGDCVIVEEKINTSRPSPIKFGSMSYGPLGARQRQFTVSTKEKRLKDNEAKTQKSILAQIKNSKISASKKPPAINSSWLQVDLPPSDVSYFKKKFPFQKPFSKVGKSSIVKTPKIDYLHAFQREDHLKYSAILSGAAERNVFPRPFLLQHRPRSLFHKEVNGTGSAILPSKVKPASVGEGESESSTTDVIILDEGDEDDVKILSSRVSPRRKASVTHPPLPSGVKTKSSDVEVIEIVDFYSPPNPRSRRKSPPRRSTLEEELQLEDVAKGDFLEQLRAKYDHREQQNRRRIAEQKVIVKHSEERCDRQIELTVEERLQRHLKLTEVAIPEPPTPEPEPEELEDDEVTLPELTPEMEKAIQSAMSSPDRVTLIEAYKIPITRNDLDTLRGLNWLNDEIINFYMQMIVDRSTKYDNWPTVYAVNTFFYPKLKQSGHSALRRWTRKVDIFAHDLILVPVHLGMHWCLATIDLKKKGVFYYDSMGGNNEECLRLLLKYLQDEHLDKRKTPFDVSGFTAEIVKDIPQQMNGSDCGMFTCKFAEYLSRNANITFSQENMPYFRQRMIYEISKNILMYP